MNLRFLLMLGLCVCASFIGAVENPAVHARTTVAAADQAASQEAEEQQAWLLEQQRWQAHLSLLAQQRQQEQALCDQLAQKQADLSQERTDIAQQHKELGLWSSMLVPVHAQLQQRLGQLEQTLYPGIIPPAELLETDVLGQFLYHFDRLHMAIAAADTWSESIEEGLLNDEQRAVRLLRCGAVAAWWLDFDGQQAGCARMVQGVLHLEVSTDVDEQKAIQAAVSIAAGQRSPMLIELPFVHAQQQGAQQ